VWVEQITVAVGPWRVGIRTDSELAATKVRSQLSGLPLVDDAAPGFSIVVGETTRRPSGAQARPLAALRHGPCVLLASRSIDRIVLALAHHLDALDERPVPDVVARCALGALVSGDRAVLLPQRWIWMAGMEQRLARAGLAVVDTPVVGIGPGRRLVGRAWSPSERVELAVDAVVVGGFLDDRTTWRWPDTAPGRVAALAELLRQHPSEDPQLALEVALALAPSMTRDAPPALTPAVVADHVTRLLAPSA
jgi:hypothetical protein